jgi:pantoate--beta-alanine ligase
MVVVYTIEQLHAFLASARAEGNSVGLVPTMGALHDGHASLVKRCVEENGVTVVSVFVNPTQFNDKGDLERYPRTLEADCCLLEALGTSCVFAPSVEEVYPEPDTRVFDFSPLDKVMEGVYRPGHFNGVAQIVSKLFAYVEPQRAYFGEKDFQQLAIIRDMVRQLSLSVEIVGCPIVRETDGLALSSRNALLTPEQRVMALNISRALFASVEYAKGHTLEETKRMVEDAIASTDGLELEYYEIVNGTTLQTVCAWDDAEYIVGCITVYCGKVRLIDNIRYK